MIMHLWQTTCSVLTVPCVADLNPTHAPLTTLATAVPPKCLYHSGRLVKYNIVFHIGFDFDFMLFLWTNLYMVVIVITIKKNVNWVKIIL